MGSEREEPRQSKAEGLFAAWASRIEAGEELDFDELLRANAELEPELRALHDDWKHFAPILGNVVPGLIASGDGLVLPSLTRGPDVDEGPPSDELLEKLGLHAPDTKRYRFRGRIGTGGQGVVLKVWDAKLSRPLAMKIVLGRAEDQPTGQTPRVDGRRLTRFVDEARIASQLNHPGIVPVHELGADESGRAFFTMKLVKGDDLARIFEKVKRGEDGVGLPRAVSYLLRVCEAMAYAHDRGVIHRDLKPANVMVGAYGEVHVMDWGLARVIGDGANDASAARARATEPVSQVDSVRRADRETTPGSVLATEHGDWIGTPCYMSPEQARGDNAAVGPQSDVYAVGAMLYQLLTGTPPYVPPGERVSGLIVLRQTIHGPPPPVESLAPRAIPELVAICERAMARDPAARYGSMRDLAADLQAFLENRVVSAHETGAWAETRKWVKRNRALASSLTAVVLVLAAGLTGTLAYARVARKAEADAKQSTYYAAVIGAQAARAANEPASVRRLLDSAPAELRNWEWRYLDAVSDTSLLKLEGRSAQWSPDGSRIVTCRANDARLWDARNGAGLAMLLGHTARVNCAAFSPDGSRIVTASDDKSARVWDSASGRGLTKFGEHTDAVLSAAFSPDGTLVVTASADTTARVWESASGRERTELKGHTKLVRSAVFSADGSRIATAAEDETARVWDATSGHELARADFEVYPVDVLAFSPDGMRIVTVSRDHTPCVWDAHSGNVLAKLEGHEDWIQSAEFSPDGLRIVTASSDATARVWDAANGIELARLLGHTDGLSSAAFSPDGSRIVTASRYSSTPGVRDCTTRVWDSAGGRELAKLEGHVVDVLSAVFSPDGLRIVSSSYDSSSRVWDLAGGPLLAKPIVWDSQYYSIMPERPILVGHDVCTESFSPDGSCVLT